MAQLPKESITELLPYLEWIDTFHEIRFKQWFQIPVSKDDYTIKSYFPDVGFFYWYSYKTGMMQRITFCMKEYQLLEKPLIKSTLGELLNSVNTCEEGIPWYYLYRMKKGHIRDAIRIGFKRPIDMNISVPRGFHISHGYMCHSDGANLTHIQRLLEENRTIRTLTTLPRREVQLQLYNRCTEGMIIFKGTVPDELVELCKKYGYRDKTEFEGSE